MGVKIVNSQSTTLPLKVVAPMISVKKSYSDDWIPAPDLEFIGLTKTVGGAGISTLNIQRRYGLVMDVYETELSKRESINYMDWFIKVNWVSDRKDVEEFIGIISSEPRDVHGGEVTNAGETLDTGDQQLIAYGPQNILRKKYISDSYWVVQDPSYVAGTTPEDERYIETTIGWVPAVNHRDRKGNLYGNRTASPSDGAGTYRYGGTSTWNNKEYLEYIFEKFLNTDTFDGYKFTLTGQLDLLEGIKRSYEMPPSINALQLLKMLIPRKHGVDFKIEPDDNGFAVQVFSRVSKERTFGEVTIPKNPNSVRVKTADLIDMVGVRIVSTNDHKYSKIRILGERMVMCTSLETGVNTLEKRWADDIEDLYQLGGGGVTAGEMDRYRRTDKFRPVYRQYGAPDTYSVPAPVLNADGSVPDNYQLSAYQTLYKKTLTWTPMKEGFDYSTVPATDNTDTVIDAGQMPPQAWILDQTGTFTDDFEDRWVPVEMLDMGIAVLSTDLGLYIDSNPNHRLALNHWDAAYLTETQPLYDYDNLILTLAFELDQRLKLEYTVPDGDDGSVMDIYIPNAQLWLLDADTYVGVDEDTGNMLNSGDKLRVLRNDAELLHGEMAGAIGMYIDNRSRAEIKIKRHVPWGFLLGQVLAVIEEKNDSHEIDSIITTITWDAQGDTTIQAGYAK